MLLVLVFSNANSLSITGPSFESTLSSVRLSRCSIIESIFASIQPVIFRFRTRMFGRSLCNHHTLSSRILLSEVFDWIDKVRQFHVFSKALNDRRRTRFRPRNTRPRGTQIRDLSFRPTVAAWRQYFMLCVSRSLYHR